MVPSAPPEKAGESLHRQAEARAAWEATRSQMPSKEYARWFTVRRDEQPRKVEQLSGPWAEGIDAKQTDIHLEGQLVLPPYGDVDTLDDLLLHHEMETLLRSGSDALVFRMTNETDDDT